MNDISFKIVDLKESKYVSQRVFELVSKELGGNRTTSDIERLIDYKNGTLVLGGFVGNEMVCMNAFMPMPFVRDSHRMIGYQSGFSATSSDHRGKGYWPKLLKASEDILREAGGSFIFGFPNTLSHPLFVNKLGYDTIKTFKERIAILPGLTQRFFAARKVELRPETFRPDVQAHIDWKKRASEEKISTFKENDSIIWGKVRSSVKLGFPIKFLELGSMSLAPHADVPSLIKKVGKKARVPFLYLSVNEDNEIYPLMRPQGAGQPIIIKSIGELNVIKERINFYGGLMDTF